MSSDFSHFDDRGQPRMIDVTEKDPTTRAATAGAVVLMRAETLAMILEERASKGDVLAVASLAGIMAAKRTADLIPMCHPLSLTGITVDAVPNSKRGAVEITATCRLRGSTGVEMEALTAAAVAALTVYDMCKSADRGMRITDLRLLHKSGGQSGAFFADGFGSISKPA
jgi:cyclic pyranopterin phosphate synthase